MNNIDDGISYFKQQKWNIEGQMLISQTLYKNVYGEVIIDDNPEENEIYINRTFSCPTDDGVIYFEFDETILKSITEGNIFQYKLKTPISADPLSGLYVASFNVIHSMYAQKQGGFSAQEMFIKNSDDIYKNNGFMFKNAKIYLKWDFLYTKA